jgi:hypothetical protein
LSLSKYKYESKSDANADSNTLTRDIEIGVHELSVFEPIIKDGELDQSSVYVCTADSSMMDPVSQLEISLAELSMRAGRDHGSPELRVAEPVGDYSFL